MSGPRDEDAPGERAHPRTLFITATGTGVGKTWLTRGLAHALARRGRAVAAIKPFETGCADDPADALALARASGARDPVATANAPGLYRARSPVAPLAATLLGEPPPPALDALVANTRAIATAARAEVVLVEGAGGLLVPIDDAHDIAHFARLLGAPLVLVARDELGVLSYVLTAALAARAHDLSLAAVVLTRHAPPREVAPDASLTTNARILRARLACPVASFGPADDDDASLAETVERAGLLATLGL